MKQIITPSPVWQTIIAPPSKSIAIRAIAAGMIAALQNNSRSIINNISDCEDVATAINIAKQFGTDATITKSNQLIIENKKIPIFDKIKKISCRESALCYRLFPFIAASLGQAIVFYPEGTLAQRNSNELLTVLENANLINTNNISNAQEINISGKLIAGEYNIDCSSTSQILSGLLFCLPLCNENSVLYASNIVSQGYIDLTLDILKAAGIEIQQEVMDNNSNGNNIKYLSKGNQHFLPLDISIEGDWSIAANFFVLGAIGGEVTISNLNTNSIQPDRIIYDLFRELNIDCEEIANSIIKIRKSQYNGFEFDATNYPDLIPPLVVLGLNGNTSSKIKGIARLTNKESNRKNILLKVFSMFGGKIKIDGDCFEVFPSKLSGGFADSHNDHRIAMAIGIASKIAKMPTTLTGSECVHKSFPDFWKYI
jgi:3-phosphoshikimate 1-carboxyvinyltransferase